MHFNRGVVVVAVLGVLLTASRAHGESWKVGVAAARITPDKPVVLLGFPNRLGPSTSVGSDIWAKAIAFEDPNGHRSVIVTADLVGFQAHYTTNPVAARLTQLTGLPRERFIFNASHTHTAPLVSLDPRANSTIAHPPLTETDAKQTVAYTRSLQARLVGVVTDALKDLKPATLSYGTGEVAFPMNRRLPTPNGVGMAPNPRGIVDRGVPVLRAAGDDGKIRAILFGCACHCVAMGGAANVIHGDYAGVAQAALQERHADAVALFMAGCGADANPEPMGSAEIAEKHGKTLADVVDKVVTGDGMKPVAGVMSTRYAEVKLPLVELTRETLKPYLARPDFQSFQAKHVNEVLDSGGELLKEYAAPVGVWRFGETFTLVALPGEPVAEYVSLVRGKLGGTADNTWVAGYNNDCFGYLPTARVVEEGGHEAIGVTLWTFGNDVDRQVGFFAPAVQEVVLNAVADLAAESKPQQ